MFSLELEAGDEDAKDLLIAELWDRGSTGIVTAGCAAIKRKNGWDVGSASSRWQLQPASRARAGLSQPEQHLPATVGA